MANVVLVVDMVRGFWRRVIPSTGRDDPRGSSSPSVACWLRSGPAAHPSSSSATTTPRMTPSSRCSRPTASAAAMEAEVIPELQDFADEVIPKTRFSGFYGTNLDQRLRKLKPDKVIVVGVCTDICVMHTVADARNRDYPVEVPADCVATFDAEAHRFALQHMEKILGAKVVAPASEAPRKTAR